MLDSSISEEYAIWRLVTARIATLQEIETHWSLEDLISANAVLDMQKDIEEQQHREMQKRRK